MAEGPRVHVLQRRADTAELVKAMGFASPRPVLVLVGGASGLAERDVVQLTDHLRRYVLPTIQRVAAVVVDGGTNSGVMRAIGRVRRGTAEPFPLVGVVARGALAPAGPADVDATRALEPNHTDLVVVPGNSWGDEVPWLGRIATAVARSRASVTLLVNGGEIAYSDMRESLRRDRPVVVLAGSGRTADHVAAAAEDPSAPPEVRQLAESPLTAVVPYGNGPRLRKVLDALLGPAII